jgi:tripartite-type tricarboxylate transporter receptor subunit TctC
MSKVRTRTVTLRAIYAAALAFPAYALAQSAEQYPSKQVRVVVPYTPGGANDIFARTVVTKAITDLGRGTLVDNRPGGNTTIGTQLVARSAPDGHTLLMVDNAYTIGPSVQIAMAYDTLKDFARVTMIARTSPILVVHPSVPARNIKELIAVARREPGLLSFGSTGSGTTGHLSFAQLKLVSGVDAVHIPYKGGAQQVTALLSGEVSMLMAIPAGLLPHIKTGRMRPIAVSGSKRLAALPDLPTLQDSGVPVVVDAFWGTVAPAATGAAIVNKLQEAIAAALKSPEMHARLEEMQFQSVGSSPAQFEAFVQGEVARWVKVVKAAGVKVD